MAKRRCPIEMEPRTLNQGQFALAREVAGDMFHKEQKNEKSEIFIQGMKPLIEIEAEFIDNTKNGDASEEDNKTTHEMNTETCSQCLCKSIIVETPEDINLNEPLSAPF